MVEPDLQIEFSFRGSEGLSKLKKVQHKDCVTWDLIGYRN